MSIMTPKALPRGAFTGFWRNLKGATAIEYGLIVACLVLVIIVAIDFVGEESSSNFNNVANTMENAIN